LEKMKSSQETTNWKTCGTENNQVSLQPLA